MTITGDCNKYISNGILQQTDDEIGHQGEMKEYRLRKNVSNIEHLPVISSPDLQVICRRKRS